MTPENLTLIEPSLDFEADFLAMAREYLAAGAPREKPGYEEAMKDFAAYVRKQQDMARGLNLAPGLVPQTTFWLIHDGRAILAMSRLRHRLTPKLEQDGGHLGYGTRPSERRRGYGTLICALTLAKARALGLGRVLLTCNVDNAASARIIEKNGGVLQDLVRCEESGVLNRRYWIEL
jgi:predicted acetyltransferase